jgi:hypothetical protein
MLGGTKLAALANSSTVDRSGKSNTLTENGTVTEGAVASGAELKGYSGWSASNYLARANDADYNAIGTGAVTLSGWFKTSGASASEWLFGIGNTGGTLRFNVYLFADEKLGTVDDGATANVQLAPDATYNDGKWHQIVYTRTSSVLRSLYVDGVLQGTSTTDAGSLTGTIIFQIGLSPEGDLPATSSTLSLVRLSSSVVSASQVKQMYEAEAPMFEANVKVLLQSGSTDAVLDATVDPLTGKYIVTQTDSQEIFDGLAIETERTVATGGSTFEHGLLFGDAVAEINNANLFASTPATDQRQVNEMVRSLSAELPAGVDLSKAKAWVVDTGKTGSTIAASLNIESGAYDAAGIYTFVFAVPFKTDDYVVSVVADGDNTFGLVNSKTRLQCTVKFRDHANADTNSRFSAVFFGELENE